MSEKRISRNRAWQIAKARQGLCVSCGNRKGEMLTFLDGTSRRAVLCRRCKQRRRKLSQAKS